MSLQPRGLQGHVVVQPYYSLPSYLDIVHSAADQYILLLHLSGVTHACLIDRTINYALYTVTTCMHPTSSGNVSILAGIQPTELHVKTSHIVYVHRFLELYRLIYQTCQQDGKAT